MLAQGKLCEESRTAYFQELTRFSPSISLREAEAAGAARSLVGRHGDLLRMTVSEASDREFFSNLLVPFQLFGALRFGSPITDPQVSTDCHVWSD